MTTPDDHDPQLTRAMGIWAESAVPALPDDFTARVMADVAAQRAGAAWADAAVPELPEGFAAAVAAKAAARPKLQVLGGGAAGGQREATPAAGGGGARRWWRWPAVAAAAAALLAVLSSRAVPTGEHPGPVAERGDGAVPRVAPAPTANPVVVAMAEVTRVEVLGAQSVAVLSIGGEGGSPVVWITDKAEDSPGDGLETRMQ
ncbi:MAG: hypothetical protein Q7V43_14015 [Myxococcales bacterium]|nr:hypothetical protein [Myxococcales bacterium]